MYKALTPIRFLLCWILIVVPSAASALSGGPIEGRVLDDETNAPVAGATVVVQWSGTPQNFLHGVTSVCHHVDITTSDSHGVFKVPRWSTPWKLSDLLLLENPVGFDVYKSGYVRPSIHPWNFGPTVYIKKFNGTREKYVMNLSSVAGKYCGAEDGSITKLVPFIEMIYQEAKAFARTPDESKVAEIIYDRRLIMHKLDEPDVRPGKR